MTAKTRTKSKAKQKQIPSLRYGMTNKSECGDSSPTAQNDKAKQLQGSFSRVAESG
jgi:hypothetical protein